ncbi:hypothetical protein P22_2113 [Propionispora sp. 2/2-37]|uniref:alpha-L-rhamnosidase n=1 Tax=Propionispora sp. 2/2-37 TaxID=1677858 RepID=UPI0006C6CDCD|nr:alpha-L-rhamnosidase [Propionispora sp. 2/2-37]CUH96025.1 hypothetical protein P22_2113 [Propionispora sp. 2/2-37]
MHKIVKWAGFLCVSFLLFSGRPCYAVEQAAEFYLHNLQVEHMTEPLGLDEKVPHFSWQMQAAAKERGLRQTAYEIIVKDNRGQVVWNTGKVEDGISLNIAYAGAPLQPETRYTWTVKVWNQAGRVQEKSSVFETGLNLERQGEGDWSGAQWIGGDDDLPLAAHSLAVYKISYDMRLMPGAERAGFVFGANDSRLMDRNKNMYQLENKKDQSYIKLVVDVAGLKKSPAEPAKLKIYRSGYSPTDSPGQPLTSLDIPPEAINAGNLYTRHNVEVSSNHGILQFNIDGKKIELPQVNFWTAGYNVNPVGPGGDYISFPMVADIGFALDKGQRAEFSSVRILNYRSPGNTVFFEKITPDRPYTGIFSTKKTEGFSVSRDTYLLDGGKDGLLLTADPSHGSMPMLRSVFKVPAKQMAAARLYVTSRGVYEFYINGRRVGQDYLAPGFTQYNVTQLYQTYDVKEFIKKGQLNAIGAQLAEGWWSGAISFQGENWNYFGDRQSLLAKLVLTYKDGTQSVITTNPETWKYFGQGPVVLGSIFQGEIYDAGKEKAVEGWSRADYDDALWKKAKAVPADENTAFIGTWKHCMTGTVKEQNYANVSLIGQEGAGVNEVLTLTAKEVKEAAPQTFIYDMGQNMAGVPDIRIKNGKAGTKLTLRYAEMLYPENEAAGANAGQLMLENIRGALAQDTYILKGGDERIRPRFTYHGYRYLEITGLDKALPLRDVRGKVLSSVRDIRAGYETSSETVNRLWQNIVWSTRANFLSIPTDCPQRNERMGWSGDLSMFARTAGYITDTDRFLDRHLQALRDLQDPDGRFGDIAPIGNGFGGILWGSAGMTVPWELYEQYGDTGILQKHYEAMKKYMAYLDTNVAADGLIGERTLLELGDWLGPEYSKNEPVFLWTVYHIYGLDIMARTAAVLGQQKDADFYRGKYIQRKSWFNKKFIDPATHKTIKSDGSVMDTQTSYAVPLALGIFDQDNAPDAAKHLVAACTRENTDDNGVKRGPYALMTGFIGTAWISKALSDYGHSDIAYKMLENKAYPSWLYPVQQGATTIWERLDSYTKERGFGGNNSMNSFNHYSFGAVGAWLCNYSLGIQRDAAAAGFKHFVLQPQPDFAGALQRAEGYYDSPYGRIASGWRLEDHQWFYDAVVPANTTATLYLPVSSLPVARRILENGQPIDGNENIVFKGYREGKALYELQSGSYYFVIPDTGKEI